MKTKIAFLGSRPLGARCLRYLTEQKEVEICGVVTRPKGSQGWWGPPEVIDVAEELGLEVLEEKDLKRKELDLILSVLYDKILKGDIINIPKRGAINLHNAPLPDYRGCNSFSHAIMNNESKYGVTIHYINEGIDTGPIIKVAWFNIDPDMTARELYERAQDVAFNLFVETLPKIISGNISATPQSPEKYYYPRNSLSNKEANLSWEPQRLYNFVRALTFPPFEKAFIRIGDKKLYLSIK